MSSSDNRCLNTLKLHQGKVYKLVVHQDRLYSASSDKTIKIWDISTLECLATLAGHEDGVNSIVPIGFGKLASGASDKSVRIWDLATCQAIQTINDTDSEILGLTTGQGMLFTSTYDTKISAYNLNDYSRVSTDSFTLWR
ncbi:E3 ubiquitin-protein ligase traf7 [Quaeritorhiza haematococci]|nr:E3 ubiquitin-protein ligase traf7 [Quaeritorhiza haematococci]